jgi:hypothetical protein
MFLDLFQTLELCIELMVPREKHGDLEEKSSAANDETCYG